MSRYAHLIENPDPDDAPPPPPWGEVRDLGPAWRGERHDPPAVVMRRSDGVFILPPGINYLFGDSGDGKSWVALVAALEAVRAGRHAVWITYEDPNELELVKRLRALGATFDELSRLHVIIATDSLTQGIEWLARLIRALGAAVVVIDSIGEANAVEGIDENSDTEWGTWARWTLRRLVDLAADPEWIDADDTPVNDWVAVWPIDHSTKAKDNPYYPSGTKRKRAMVTGVMVMLQVRQSFGIGVVGRVNLIVAKDRTGRFRRGEIAAEISLDATFTPYTVAIDPPANGAEMATVRKRKAEDRVLSVIEDTEVALSAAEVHRIVNTDEHRLPGEGDLTIGTVKNTLGRLAKRSSVKRQVVPSDHGIRHLYLVTTPSHDDDGTTPDAPGDVGGST